METLRHIVIVVHLLGFAVLFGAWVSAWIRGTFKIDSVMTWGMVIAFASGLALAAPWGVDSLNYVKIAVKLGILLVIAALLGIGQSRQRKTGSLPPVMFWLIGILTVANAAIAVMWR